VLLISRIPWYLVAPFKFVPKGYVVAFVNLEVAIVARFAEGCGVNDEARPNQPENANLAVVAGNCHVLSLSGTLHLLARFTAQQEPL
jgi:hypothetical protein